MNVIQTAYAVAPYIKASFLAQGGQEPYTYEIIPDGAGGSINASTGWYQAPAVWNPDPRKAYDKIRATDAVGATAEAEILVASPLKLLGEIISRVANIPFDRVFLYQQKINTPQDEKPWVSLLYQTGKAFGNNNRAVSADDADPMSEDQYIAEQATIEVQISSRSTEALWKKEEVLLALSSDYSQNQQTRNTFYIGRLPTAGMIRNISQRDGAAIPYRFAFPINIQFAYPRNALIEFYDNFEDPEITVNP